MAVPTVVGTGAIASSAAAITPAFPANMAVDDVIVGIGECAGGAAFPSAATNGFAHVTGSPVTQDTQTVLTGIWRRYDGVVTAHSWGDSGDHNVGRYIALRGVQPSGDPWNQVIVAVESTANTSVEWPNPADTTVADCLVLLAIATGRDANSTANLGAPTGGNLTNLVEQIDNWVSVGGGGGIGLITGEKTTAGAITTPTATMGSTDTKAMMTIALQPPEVMDNPIPGQSGEWRRPRIVTVSW